MSVHATVFIFFFLLQPVRAADERSNVVQLRYKTYLQRFQKTHELLRQILTKEAPELMARLSPQAPQPIVYGYQILPTLLPGAKTPIYQEELLSRYSWPITERYLQWEESMVDDVEQKLSFLKQMQLKDRRPILGQIVTDLVRMEKNQQLIDHHIQHNLFWQKAISDDRPRFDRLTVLAKAAEELQQITHPRTSQTDRIRLASRQKELSSLIQKQTGSVVGKPVYKIKTILDKKSKFANVIITVPLTTDIENAEFLQRFKKAIERTWKFKSSQTHFHLALDLKTIPTRILYTGTPSPKKGEHINAIEHIKRFPLQSAVLTTGSNSTYALPSRAIILGPQPLYEQTLAHEFGHILGFADTYFRGYKDLGKDGFEIIEIVPDATDIMSMPDSGSPQLHHFKGLVLAAESKPSNTHSSDTDEPLPAHTSKSVVPGKKAK